MKEWFKKRHILTHENLLKELETSEPGNCAQFLSMYVSTYDLLQMMAPFIEREGTVVRNSNPRCFLLIFVFFWLLDKHLKT
jgi:hypothetical protein